MVEFLPSGPTAACTNPVLLAPMEGVVDWAMRDVLTRIGGIDLCVTEFIRVTDRLLPEHEFFKYCPELRTGSKTRAGVPVLVQLLGGQPEPMGENAARAAQLGAPGIDLNFGCPAKTVNRHDGGAALLKNPSRVYDVVKAVRAATPSALPVSAKVRLGFSDKSLFLEIAAAAQEGGAKWLAVHARTRDEGYRPPAHWEHIARIRESLRIPVIANGEIWTLEDAFRCREVSGCESLMIGRGLIAAPDLALRAKDPTQRALEWHETLRLLIEFTELSEAARDPRPNASHYAVCRCKQWLKQLARTHPEAATLFESIKTILVLDPLLHALRTHLHAPKGGLHGPSETQGHDLHEVALPLLRGREELAVAERRPV